MAVKRAQNTWAGGVFSLCDEDIKKTNKQTKKQATAPPQQKKKAATTKWSFKMEKQSTEQQKWSNH